MSRITCIGPKQTMYSYYRVSRVDDPKADKSSSPEEHTAKALENLLFGEGVKTANPPSVSLKVRNLVHVGYLLVCGRT